MASVASMASNGSEQTPVSASPPKISPPDPRIDFGYCWGTGETANEAEVVCRNLTGRYSSGRYDLLTVECG